MSPHPRRGISIGLLGHLLLSGPAIAQVARIPFEFHRNKILLPVTVNGSGPYEFILDSGSPVTVVSSLAMARGPGFSTERRVAVSGGGDQAPPPAAVLGSARVDLGPGG